jgi:hypothetical protein
MLDEARICVDSGEKRTRRGAKFKRKVRKEITGVRGVVAMEESFNAEGAEEKRRGRQDVSGGD